MPRIWFLIFLFVGLGAAAQSVGPADMAVPAASEPQTESPTFTMFPHSQTSRFWVSGQVNVIFQAYPDFHSPYSGPNSLSGFGESKTSRVATLFLGAQVTHRLQALVSIETSGGRGIGDALGLAGFTNLDVVRNPTLGSAPYLARAIAQYTLPLSKDEEDAVRTPLSLATKIPVRRLDFRVGRMSTVDFFDQNSVGSDSHLQFLNWTVDNNGAYDYAADTRGYTYGVMAEYQDKRWGVRFGEMLMPKVANGIDLDWNLRRSRAENIEFEFRPQLLKDQRTVIRLLSYVNHANMGTYSDAIERFKAGIDPTPVIENTREPGTIKYGFGFNMEQDLPKTFQLYTRLGWNEGQHESFAYTEANSTISFGAAVSGTAWHRKYDKVGAAFVSNGISAAHQEYLRLGGLGFLLGDGNLNYGRETILEGYYTMHLWRGLYWSFDLQHVNNPGYNRDRGPVLAPGVRVHIDL